MKNGAATKNWATTTAAVVNGSDSPTRREWLAEDAAPPNTSSSARPATDGGKTIGRSTIVSIAVRPGSRPRARASARGRSQDEYEHDRDARGQDAEPQRIENGRRGERLQHRPAREPAQDENQDRQAQDEERWRPREEKPPARSIGYGAAPNPWAARTACASGERIQVRKSAAVVALGDALTAAPPYVARTFESAGTSMVVRFWPAFASVT